MKKIALITTDVEFKKGVLHSYNLCFNSDFFKIVEFDDLDSFIEVVDNSYCCVILDLSSIEQKVIDFKLEKTMLLRKSRRLTDLTLVSVWSNKNLLLQNKKAFSHGVSYAYIKGEDDDRFLTNLAFLLTDVPANLKEYAVVNIKKVKLELVFPCYVSQINTNSITVESDLVFDSSVNLNFDNSNVEVIKNGKFKPSYSIDEGCKKDFFSSNILKYNFDGNWGDSDSSGIDQDTVDTWIENNPSSYASSKNSVGCYCDSLALVKGNTLEHSFFSKNSIKFYKELSSLLETITEDRTQLIIVDFNGMKKGEQEKFIDLLIRKIFSVESYEPRICLFASSYDSTHLRDHFSYNSIITYTGELRAELLCKLLDVFRVEGHSTTYTDDINLKLPFRLDEAAIEVDVSSLSENVLKFTSKYELPAFSVVEFYKPIHGFILLYPQEKTEDEEYKYMGLIHGCSAYDYRVLRKFVNHGIEVPVTSFEFSEKLLEEESDEVETQNKQNKAVKANIAKKIQDKDVKSRKRLFRKSKI